MNHQPIITISVPHGMCMKDNQACDSKANLMASEIKRLLQGYPLIINLHIYDQDHHTWMNSYEQRNSEYRRKLLDSAQNSNLHLDIHSFDPEYHTDWRNYELIVNITENENSDVNELIKYLKDAGISAQVSENKTDIREQMDSFDLTSLSIYLNERISINEVKYLSKIMANWLISG